MARRLGAEKPYTPLDNHLLSSVLAPTPEPPTPAEPVETRVTADSTTEVRRVSRRTLGVRHANGGGEPQRNLSTPLPDTPGRGAPSVRTASAERMNATLRLKVASRDKREFEAFTARLAAALDTTLKPSNLLRAMLTVMQNAEPLLNEVARREAPLKRPPNDDAFAYADFEHRLVRMIDSAIRQSTPLQVMRARP